MAVVADLADTVFGCSVPIAVTRFQPASTDRGRIADKPKAITISANYSIQPMSQKELMRLPEGQRNKGRVKGYGDTELLTSDTSTCGLPDRFSYKGVVYQVDKVDDWVDLGNYYRIEAERMGQ
jgi:hypothetical protein